MPDNSFSSEEKQKKRKEQWFPTTHWTQIMKGREEGSPQATEALNQLCAAYWYPLYAYVRRRGYPDEQAQDLTQSFFVYLFERNLLGVVDRKRGRFRSFLLASLNYFLANARDKEQAVKRGGRFHFVSLDEKQPDERYVLEPATDLSPEKLFERSWALTVLEQAQANLRADYAKQGKAELFDALRMCLKETGGGDYAALAVTLGMTAQAVSTAVFRLRHRYGEMLNAEIERTVGSAEEVERERQHIYRALSLN